VTRCVDKPRKKKPNSQNILALVADVLLTGLTREANCRFCEGGRRREVLNRSVKGRDVFYWQIVLKKSFFADD